MTLVTRSGGQPLAEPLPRGPATDAQMRSHPVVVADEALERKAPLAAASEDLQVEAFRQRGPDPALRLAVGPGPVGSGARVLDAEPSERPAEGAAPIGVAVVA